MILFFLLSDSENRIEKRSCFYQELCLFKNGRYIFNFWKNVDVSETMGICKINYKIWKTLMIHYHCYKFLASSISPFRDIDRDQKWPPQTYTDPKSQRSNMVNIQVNSQVNIAWNNSECDLSNARTFHMQKTCK